MSDPVDQSPSRLRFTRRHIVTGLLLGGASLTAQARQPQIRTRAIPLKTFSSWVPHKFGDWKAGNGSGVVLPPPDALSDRQYDDLATLSYFNPTGDMVMVCIAYNYRQDGVVQIHRPEVCYPSGGFAITQPVNYDLKVKAQEVPALFFTATSSQRTEQVMYWTRLGSRFPRQWIEQRWSIALSNLLGTIPDGVLARFSMVGTDPKEAQAKLSQFIADFSAASNPQLQRVMFGTV